MQGHDQEDGDRTQMEHNGKDPRELIAECSYPFETGISRIINNLPNDMKHVILISKRIVVKLRSRSGEGWVRDRFGPEQYNIFGLSIWMFAQCI